MPQKGSRPTSDRVREALFNVLTARLDFAGLRVLDLYAGSGALGLEALSRGATHVTLVESDARAAAVIERNVAAVGLPGATVATRRAAAFLEPGTDEPFDLVLADPPYDIANTEVEQLLTLLGAGRWTAAGATVVVERRASGPELTWPDGWTVRRSRRYGDTRLELAEAC